MVPQKKKKLLETADENTWTWVDKGNIKREIEILLTTELYNAIGTNDIKAEIDIKQQNSGRWLCEDRDETVYHKLANAARVGKVIDGELCNRLKFVYTTKQYMHKPKSTRENQGHRIIRNFMIQTKPLIQARRLD